MTWFLEQIAVSVLGCFVSVLCPVMLFYGYKKWKFSGWKVIVKDGDTVRTTRLVGPKKAEQVLDDTSDLSVFIKGVVSPYCRHLNEDVISDKSRESGLFKQLDKEKTWVVDIAKNPPDQQK